MASPATPPLRSTGEGAACTPAKRRRLRAASTVKRLWMRTRWSILADDAPPGPGVTEVQSAGCVTDISVERVPDAELPDLFTQEQVKEISDQLKETYKRRQERLECQMNEAKQHITNSQDEVKKHILSEETYEQKRGRLQHELDEANKDVEQSQDKIEKYSSGALQEEKLEDTVEDGDKEKIEKAAQVLPEDWSPEEVNRRRRLTEWARAKERRIPEDLSEIGERTYNELYLDVMSSRSTRWRGAPRPPAEVMWKLYGRVFMICDFADERWEIPCSLMKDCLVKAVEEFLDACAP